MNNNSIPVSGMLNQHEFLQRYSFIARRVANRFSIADLAFLIGKSAFDVMDYERLCGTMRLGMPEHEIMSAIYAVREPKVPLLVQKEKDIDISNDKHMVRGKITESLDSRQIEFFLPWSTKGKDGSFMISEDLTVYDQRDERLLACLPDRLKECMSSAAQSNGYTAATLYRDLYAWIPKEQRPLLARSLRSVVFEHVRAGILEMRPVNGQVFYRKR